MQNEALTGHANACYQTAEREAAHYFKILHEQLVQKTYVSTLQKNLQSWKQNHVRPFSLFHSFFQKNGHSNTKNYDDYIEWLRRNGKLDHYLDRSVSYIYMRDLGKTLSSPETKNRIQHVVDGLKSQLTLSNVMNTKNTAELFSAAWLYRLSQKEGVESTVIWVIGKLKTVSDHIPKEMDATEAQRKLIKIIAGVIIHTVEEMDATVTPEERSKKLEGAIKLGYCYGLTYPFIDDLLDAQVLSDNEKKRYAQFIRSTLLTGTVPKLEEWTGKNKDLIGFIHSELRDAFAYMKLYQRPETRKSFFEQSYVFFNAQEVDRLKDLENPDYTNDELYIPVILKSSYSRLIARSIIGAPEDEGFHNRTFLYGIYNQLADDFADMFEDMKEGRVTPYTYYMKHHANRLDLVNPFELYWTVIFNLIHHVYQSDCKTCEVIIHRAINGLKRFKQKMGIKKYNEVMQVFDFGATELKNLVQKVVRGANDIDFFDKLLRDRIISTLEQRQQEQSDFLQTVETVREQINKLLNIPTNAESSLMKEPIIQAANYSLANDGKRLRPIITWVMGVNGFGLSQLSIMPLLKSLEYMHTASLIFDDLPTQDNADTRRGQPTLHHVYNSAVAELTGLFLMQKAIEEQTLLEQFDLKNVLHLIRYSSQVTADMCRGQAMDIDSKGKELTLEQLNTICFYKTGIAFEASLVMPAILANASESEVNALKQFAYHAGIAFQIKDDLLDVEGDVALLGKSVGKDAENNTTTFVSALGMEEAKKAMWEHYCCAMEMLQEVPHNTTFLKHLLNYMINRAR